MTTLTEFYSEFAMAIFFAQKILADPYDCNPIDMDSLNHLERRLKEMCIALEGSEGSEYDHCGEDLHISDFSAIVSAMSICTAYIIRAKIPLSDIDRINKFIVRLED